MEIRLTPTGELMTAALQAAIDECWQAGGGRVVLADGTFLTGGIRLRSRVTLYLSSGTVLKGTRDPEDYFAVERDPLEPMPAEYATDVLWASPRKRTTNDHITKAGSRWNHALIRLLHAEDAAVIGEKGAVIDGSDPYDEIGEEHYRGPHGISFHYCKNLRFSGYTIKNTGNWAHLGYAAQDLVFEDLTVLGGHDGVHVSICDDVRIERCGFYTGDDCVAGFDNERVLVRDCILNTACSAFRFGGRDVLVENCRAYGPAEYFFRGSLSLEDKISGNAAPTVGRKTMLALFTYYSDFTLKVRSAPGNIVIRNCTAENMERFVLYDFSGLQTWQKNRPLSDITFENVEARGVVMPLNLYGGEEQAIDLNMTDVTVSFKDPVPAAIRAAYYGRFKLTRVRFEGVEGPLVMSFGGDGEADLTDVTGISGVMEPATEPYTCKSI